MNKLLRREREYVQLFYQIKYDILCCSDRQVGYFGRVDVHNNVHAELIKSVSYRAHIANFIREELNNE